VEFGSAINSFETGPADSLPAATTLLKLSPKELCQGQRMAVLVPRGHASQSQAFIVLIKVGFRGTDPYQPRQRMPLTNNVYLTVWIGLSKPLRVCRDSNSEFHTLSRLVDTKCEFAKALRNSKRAPIPAK